MRFLGFPILFFVFSFSVKAGSWLDVGIKGSFGIHQLHNQNVWENRAIVHMISYGNNFGGKIGLNLDIHHQFTLDVLYGNASQNYEINDETGAYNKKLNFTELNFPLLYRFNSQQGFYYELGPQLNYYLGFKERVDALTTNVTNYFEKSSIGLVLGMGTYFAAINNMYLLLGGRFHLGLSEVLNAQGGKNSAQFYYPILNDEIILSSSNSSKTFPFMLSFNAELNFDLAHLAAKSNCKRSAFMLIK